MPAYHSEFDPYTAQWLRNLIAAGRLPPGDVDERDIRDVQPDDIRCYTQCHFFAGIGGWPYALRLAGWPDDKEVWTGSCPCQPLSCAGQRKGHIDERHLWPAFFSLISKRKPATIFGEQVSGKDGFEWLAAVRTDLEGIGYAVGAADLPACGVGAPHIRRRLFWVAHTNSENGGRRGICRPSESIGPSPWPAQQRSAGLRQTNGTMEHATGKQVGLSGCAWQSGISTGELGQPNSARSFQGSEAAPPSRHGDSSFAASMRPWSDLEWLPCIDGKWRPTKPGLQPLAHGVSARVGKLRAAGNAIVPQVAAEFIRATL